MNPFSCIWINESTDLDPESFGPHRKNSVNKNTFHVLKKEDVLIGERGASSFFFISTDSIVLKCRSQLGLIKENLTLIWIPITWIRIHNNAMLRRIRCLRIQLRFRLFSVECGSRPFSDKNRKYEKLKLRHYSLHFKSRQK